MRMVKMSLTVLAGTLFAGAHRSQCAEPPAPSVEVNYGQPKAGEWLGRRFREILPAAEMARIIRVQGSTFGGETREQMQQRYNGLVAHLLASDEKVSDYRGGPGEGVTDQLIILTKAGVVYVVEVRQGQWGGVAAVTIKGPDQGARIAVKGFTGNDPQFPSPTVGVPAERESSISR